MKPFREPGFSSSNGSLEKWTSTVSPINRKGFILLEVSRIQALCFDVDGTLCDTDDQLVKRLASWLRPVSFLLPKVDSQAASRRIVMAMENPGTYLYGLPDRLHIDHCMANLANSFSGLFNRRRNYEPLPIIPGVKEMLGRLKSHYPMAVVSARGQRSTLGFLDYYQITPFFKAIATSQTCLHTKPIPTRFYGLRNR